LDGQDEKDKSAMLSWYWHKLMQLVGYREFWYFPSQKGVDLENFWRWGHRPDLPKGVYRA
jgi:hypothetical protein